MITMSAICMWMLSVTQASPTGCMLVRTPPVCAGIAPPVAGQSIVACAHSVVVCWSSFYAAACRWGMAWLMQWHPLIYPIKESHADE
jgi:hypothetical protein